MALTAAELRVVVQASVRDAITDLNRVGAAADQTAGRGRQAGAGMQVAGRAVTAGAAAIGAGFTVAVQEGAELEQQLANINTVARLSEGDTDALGDALQQMSRDTGISTDDLTAAMYDMVSAGTITSDQLSTDLAGSMETVNSAAMLAIGGMGTVAGTTDLLTSALNAYNLESTEAANVSDIFAVAIERGKVTAEEIGASLSNVAPMAADAGISLEEISAAYATLTANGVPAAEATTQMRAAIVALTSPNERLRDVMADTGVNFAEVAAEDGLQVALQQLRDITDETAGAVERVSGAQGLDGFSAALAENQAALGLTNSEMATLEGVAGRDGVTAALAEMNGMVVSGEAGLSDALGRIEGFNFLLQTTGENSAAFGENYDAAMDSTGTAAGQAAIAMDGPVEMAKRMTAHFMTFMQDVGGPFAQTMGPMLLMFNQLAPAMGGLIRPATALGGLLGAGLGKLGTKLLPGLAGGLGSAFSGVLPMLMGPITGLVSGIGGLLAAAIPLMAAALPFLIAAAVIAAIALLIFNEDIRNAVFGFVGGIIDWFAESFSGVFEVFGRLGEGIAKWFGGFADTVGTIIAPVVEIFDTIIDAFEGAVDVFVDFVAAAFGVIAGIIGGIWDGMVAAATFVFDAVTTVVGLWVDAVKWYIGTVITIVSAIWTGVVAAAKFVWNAVAWQIGIWVRGVQAAISIVTAVVGAVWNGVVAVAKFVWEAVAKVIGLWVEGVKISIGVVTAVVGAIWNGVVAAATFVWSQISGIVGAVVAAITAVVGTFVGFLSHIWDGVTAAARVVWDAITGVIRTAVGVITGIINGIIAVAQTVWNFVSDIFDLITGGAEKAQTDVDKAKGSGYTPDYVPAYAAGTMDTGGGGLAFLHPHEAVLPEGVADAMRHWIGGGTPALASVGERGPAGADGGGYRIDKVNVTVPVQGLLRAERASDIARELRRVADLGYLTPQRALRRATGQIS